MLIMGTFLPSILFAVAGGAYQFRQLYKLHLAFPERFPPSAAVVALSGAIHRWQHGDHSVCFLLRQTMVEFKEAASGGPEQRRRSLAEHRASLEVPRSLLAGGTAPAAASQSSESIAEPQPLGPPSAASLTEYYI